MLQFFLITFHSLIPLTVNWKLIQRKRTEYFSIPQLNLINILIQIIVNPIPAFNTISLLFSLRARNSNEIVSFTRRVLACLRPFQFLWINLRDSSSVEKKKKPTYATLSYSFSTGRFRRLSREKLATSVDSFTEGKVFARVCKSIRTEVRAREALSHFS